MTELKTRIKKDCPRFYNIWQGIKRRCLNKNTDHYDRYGGRGISVCEKWLDIEGFKDDMYDTYKDGMTIERIDNNGNYCKENCRWATIKEQCNNRNNNINIEINGVTKSLSVWCEVYHISLSTAYSRYKRGITGEGLFTENKRVELDKKSGIKGVRWCKRDSKWVVDAVKDGKKKRLASFRDEDLDMALEFYKNLSN